MPPTSRGRANDGARWPGRRCSKQASLSRAARKPRRRTQKAGRPRPSSTVRRTGSPRARPWSARPNKTASRLVTPLSAFRDQSIQENHHAADSRQGAPPEQVDSRQDDQVDEQNDIVDGQTQKTQARPE